MCLLLWGTFREINFWRFLLEFSKNWKKKWFLPIFHWQVPYFGPEMTFNAQNWIQWPKNYINRPPYCIYWILDWARFGQTDFQKLLTCAKCVLLCIKTSQNIKMGGPVKKLRARPLQRFGLSLHKAENKKSSDPKTLLIKVLPICARIKTWNYEQNRLTFVEVMAISTFAILGHFLKWP